MSLHHDTYLGTIIISHIVTFLQRYECRKSAHTPRTEVSESGMKTADVAYYSRPIKSICIHPHLTDLVMEPQALPERTVLCPRINGRVARRRAQVHLHIRAHTELRPCWNLFII